MATNRFFFADLEIAPGVIVAEGYAVIRGGADWTIEQVYTGGCAANMHPISDPRLYGPIVEALERDCAEDITGQFGEDLNAGLGRAA